MKNSKDQPLANAGISASEQRFHKFMDSVSFDKPSSDKEQAEFEKEDNSTEDD